MIRDGAVQGKALGLNFRRSGGKYNDTSSLLDVGEQQGNNRLVTRLGASKMEYLVNQLKIRMLYILLYRRAWKYPTL